MKLNNIKRTFLAGAALLSTISMSAADRFVDFKQGDLLLNANNRVGYFLHFSMQDWHFRSQTATLFGPAKTHC